MYNVEELHGDGIETLLMAWYRNTTGEDPVKVTAFQNVLPNVNWNCHVCLKKKYVKGGIYDICVDSIVLRLSWMELQSDLY